MPGNGQRNVVFSSQKDFIYTKQLRKLQFKLIYQNTCNAQSDIVLIMYSILYLVVDSIHNSSKQLHTIIHVLLATIKYRSLLKSNRVDS